MNQTAYFDLHNIFVNELVGDVWLFLFIGLIAVLFLSIKARMPYQLTTLLLVLWVGIVYATVFDAIAIIWILVVLVTSVLLYYNLSKALKRG